MDTAAIFESLYDSLPEARCQIRTGGKVVIPRALCSGLGDQKASSEQGRYMETTADVRLLAAEELPPGVLLPGVNFEVLPAGQASWIKVRAGGRFFVGKILRIPLEDRNG